MSLLITLLLVCAVVAVLIWLIQQINFGPAILKDILVCLVVVAAIIKIWPML